jgi:large-conductance mechanosensitive channel
MDQPEKTFMPEGAVAGNWIGGIIVAVILGEAIWSLIVSLMNNLVVPWLGDVMGQSSGLPTSFTQRPYNYPDLFVSVVEFCIAGIVAAILNHFFQRSKGRVKRVKLVPATPAEPIRIVPPAATAIIQPPLTQPAPTPAPPIQPPPIQPPQTQASSPPAAKASPVAPPVLAAVAPAAQVPLAAPVPKPAALASSAVPVADSVAKPSPPATKAEPPKPKKPKQVYYNIVGEPVSSDEE